MLVCKEQKQKKRKNKTNNNMKTLQNNFTTLEQSKRLLELGVPADSADMVYLDTYPVPEMFLCTYNEYCKNDNEYQSQCDYPNFHKFTPCWSVGRLIEIFELCTSYLFERRNPKLSILEDVMSQISEDIIATDECWDFSKLEC